MCFEVKATIIKVNGNFFFKSTRQNLDFPALFLGFSSALRTRRLFSRALLCKTNNNNTAALKVLGPGISCHMIPPSPQSIFGRKVHHPRPSSLACLRKKLSGELKCLFECDLLSLIFLMFLRSCPVSGLDGNHLAQKTGFP